MASQTGGFVAARPNCEFPTISVVGDAQSEFQSHLRRRGAVLANALTIDNDGG
jgi:hypothetical protein